MDFQEFRGQLLAELQQAKEFRTMKLGKPFEAWAKDPSTIMVLPRDSKTGTPRPIPIRQFQSMWDTMKNDAKNERYTTTKERYPKFFNPSYVNTLIDHIVGDQAMS